MGTEPEFEEMSQPQSEKISPTECDNHLPKLKRLKMSNSLEMNSDNTNFNSNSNSSPLNESDELEKVNEWDHDHDGLDPLFGDANQFSAKRVLEFDDNEDVFSQNDADFELGSGQNNNNNKNKKKRTYVSKEELKKLKKKKTKKDNSAFKEKKERKAQIAQHADYQRVMRERTGVGFRPTPMVEKSISSVLEKIRQRKLEMSRKMMSSRRVDQTESENVAETSISVSQMIMTSEDDRPGSGTGDEQTRAENAAEISTDAAPLDITDDYKHEKSDEQTSVNVPLVDETTQSFRAPINDTQDLLLVSERSFSQSDELSESSFPVQDIAPSAPSMNLKFDSALPDDISSDEEENDKENIEPHPKHDFRGRSTTNGGDPVKAFVDEEALQDDVDHDLLHPQDKDEEDDSDLEENCDYIATDFKENQTDREKINQLHQQWDQQQDETRTKNLLQKLKYGTKNEPSLLDDEDDDDDDQDNDEESDERIEEDDDDESDKDVLHMPATRPTTKKLKAMIPQMFTDGDDGFVSSEDEETERRLSKQCLLQKVELEQQSKFLSPAEDETSREVFCRIKKLNVIPETKKKSKASTFFDALLTKGSNNNASKSSFLRRASTHPGASSHRQGSSTGKSFIFGRDDSNSRSSMSLLEDPPNLGQKEKQKKNSSAKFTCSQAKWSTQRTEVGGETTSNTSLFDILKRSSVQTGYDDTNLADQQTVFAAFKSVKKQVKIERRSYQGP